MQMLWRRRVETGVALLQSTGLPIAEIACRPGFKSKFHFSRRVNMRTGSLPGMLRRVIGVASTIQRKKPGKRG